MKGLNKISSWLAEWGVVPSKPPSGGKRRNLQLVVETDKGDLIVGQLAICAGRFEFEYSEEFKKSTLPPIPGFDKKDEKYESDRLFPFFQVRIPPTNRSDVARVLRERRIEEDDVFEKLRVLGKRTATSPYRFLSTDSTAA